MKSRIFSTTVGLMIFAASAICAAAQKPPSAQTAIKEILANGDIALFQFKSCTSLSPEFGKMTLRDLMSEIIAEQTNAGSQTSTSFEVKREKRKNGQIVWLYTLLFNTDYPEETKAVCKEKQTSLGIKFGIRNSDQKLIRNSIECLAAG